jgi:hypothetical protein
MKLSSDRRFCFEGRIWTVTTDAWRPGVEPPPIEFRPCIRFTCGDRVRYLSFESVEETPTARDLLVMSDTQLCDMLQRAVEVASAS